ncbi:hypothetical protein Kisp01_72640 [Kineosporia sp. NBRC 101677]|nr:hypothetical protein Kisp01_72640 [Kineosporia sp. NBRC 101677]
MTVSMFASIALVMAGRAGDHLASGLGLPVEHDTMVRSIRRLLDPAPDESGLQVLGVADFALRRGHHYGMARIDLNTQGPVDLLPGRDTESLSSWLCEHGQDVQVVCRDRARAYAQAARDVVPNAVQVADRWHLWHNLADHVERATERCEVGGSALVAAGQVAIAGERR